MVRSAASLALALCLSVSVFAQGWLCYGGNAQHTGIFTGTSQSAALVQWQTSLADPGALSYYGGAILVHFAAPMVTPSNTVVHGFEFTTTTEGVQSYDNWSVIGRSGSNGSQIWQMVTDFSAPNLYPNDGQWTSVYPITLFQGSATNFRGVAAAAGSGSIMVRSSADTATSAVNRLVFYTTVADFTQNQAAYAPIKINTPITADSSGNLYFGYLVAGSVPANVASLGTGGIVKINANTGKATFKSVEAMGVDPTLVRPDMNAAPALTTDQSTIYVALTGNNPWLVKLSTKDLATEAQVQLMDPSVPNGNVTLIDQSSASPMIGPDGHVFMGVFGNQWRESHGWMLQYDANLKANDSKGSRWPTGAFGWDDTAAIVPASIVPSYKGKASYLILTKYNNYDDDDSDSGADGQNHVAILDPTSNSITKDRQSKTTPVMNEVLMVLGPTLSNNDSNRPRAVCEWCINSAAIDVNTKSAIINSEDGCMYRWNFVSNTLTEVVNLQPPTGEAYTETAIGPDGQIYVINNTIMFAIGSVNATTVSTVQGTGTKGTVKDLWYVDTETYSTGSVATKTGETATIEADFTLKVANPSTLNIAVNASALNGALGSIFAYNIKTKAFDKIWNGTLSTGFASYKATLGFNVANYIASNGKVRTQFQATYPGGTAKNKFTLAADRITCNAQ